MWNNIWQNYNVFRGVSTLRELGRQLASLMEVMNSITVVNAAR